MKNISRPSGQGGGIGRYVLLPRPPKTKTTTNLKNKKQSELPENQSVWKSDNQGFKEETFIQTGDVLKKYGPNERTDQNSRKRTKQ